MKKFYIILGMPGAGKDTQADFLESEMGHKVIRVGRLVRDMADNDQELANRLAHGKLADDLLVNQLVGEFIQAQPENSTILSDGYPRNLSQAKWLSNTLKQFNCELVNVLHLTIPESEVFARLQKRGRADDAVEVINNRLKVYNDHTGPVVEYYSKQNKLISIDGLGSIDAVKTRIMQAIS